ncbi:MAG TPA: DUF262 domain-containing protein, partial [Burkholderiales bacterium]|nr:DUF262 domain-containing protein [Burkholderiales bacterium]
MSYATTSIGSLLNEINRTYFLPSIQRPFVWKQDQTIALFDSLLKGYPISSFMFWELNEATKRQVSIYRFIENYGGELMMNEPAQTEGRDVVLVLDGQQRMTSLLIGLRGTFSVKKKHARKANLDNWERQSIYINLLKDPDEEVDEDGNERDGETGVTYGLHFHTAPPRNNHRHHWLKLAAILNHPTEESFDLLVHQVEKDLPNGASEHERQIAIATLRRLYAVVWGEELINFYTERNQDPDRVLDIFVRSNSSGSPLKKPDFLMSMITSRWEHGAAREEVTRFAQYLSRDLPLPNTVGIEFLMKACLTLCDFDVRFNVANFTGDAIRTIEKNWSRIRETLENTFRLINRFGTDRLYRIEAT